MALAMFCTATAKNPSAVRSTVQGCPVASVIAAVISLKPARVALALRGWSPLGPNTAGKWSGCSRPSTTLASVTVRGPLLP